MRTYEMKRINNLVQLFNLLSQSQMTRLDGIIIEGYDFQEPLLEGGLILRIDTSEDCAVWFDVNSLDDMRVDGQAVYIKNEEKQWCLIEISLKFDQLQFFYQSHYPQSHWEKLS